MAAPTPSPVVLDGIVSREKLLELLALETEYPELDYKTRMDAGTTEGVVELAADVGAMQVRGGYLVAGTDGKGVPGDGPNGVDTSLFDEAILSRKLLKYLPEPLTLRTAVHADIHGRTVAVLFVGPHPSGCAIFRADGQYEKNSKLVVRFRKGEVFWRNGTSSGLLSQAGFEEIIERRLSAVKGEWLDEQQEIRTREREEALSATESLRRARAPLGTVNVDLQAPELNAAALELLRDNDSIALIQMLRDATARAQDAIARQEFDAELDDILNKLTCLGATFLSFEQEQWFDRLVGVLAEIYSLAVPSVDRARSFGFSTHIDPAAPEPRTWLSIIQRVFALGALAVRLRAWTAVRTLTLQLPERIDYGYEVNWLRHALTMSSRAQHLDHVEDGRQIFVSLLTLARQQVERLDCLRAAGLGGDDDAVFDALTQFDVLASVVAIGDAGIAETKVFYTNFARFRQARVQPIVERLLSDQAMRDVLFPLPDEALAEALSAIANMATYEGMRYDGFMSWGPGDRVGDFIAGSTPQAT